MLPLLLALSGQPMPPALPFAGGRVFTGPGFHVGVRPAIYVDRWETASAVTVQLSTRWL